MTRTSRFCATVVIFVSCLFMPSHRPIGGQAQQTASERDESLRNYLQEHFRDSIIGNDKTTKYFPAFASLHGDGAQQVIVYMTGRDWCGSGGCPTLVLAASGASYKLITKILITRPPIRVLQSKSKGWRDITVTVQGGGILKPYEAELSFDGETYPANPTVPPARHLDRKVAGKVVVPAGAEGTPLYP